MHISEFNARLEEIKRKHPSEKTLIEGVQEEFSRKFKVISEQNRRALRQFPLQFTQRIPSGKGEWTTQLHMWANFQLEDLLDIDPLYLTTRNSMGETVLISLVKAALGKDDSRPNYGLLQSMLDANMSFAYLEKPGDPSSQSEGNAWDETDVYGHTALDIITDCAEGTGEYASRGADMTIQGMLDEFDEYSGDVPEIAPDQDVEFNEEEAQSEIEKSEELIDSSLGTNPESIPTAEKVDSVVTPGADQTTEGKLLEAIFNLGTCLI